MRVLRDRPNLLFLITIRKLEHFKYYDPSIVYQPSGTYHGSRINEFYLPFNEPDPDEIQFHLMNTYKSGEYALHRKLLIIPKFRTELYRKKLIRVGYKKESNCGMWEYSYKIFGKLHREDGPAMKYRYLKDIYREEWYYNNRLHRDGGPAFIYEHANNRTELWYNHGVIYGVP